MAQVILEDISKVYDGGFEAVKGANLSIKDKEFMVIVGPSGCGKSTTLRMIAGLEEISGGTLSIGETVVNEVAPKDRDIAMVFQNYALYPHMTVYQNMAFGLKLRKVPKDQIKSRVNDAAKMLGIDQLLSRKPKALSGGQSQRVALGRAIVRNPAAFLFDEPLSNLDAKLRVTTRAELKALHNRLQTTSIYVTHDQAEAMTLGDRICVMYDGVIQQIAAPMDVYDRPVNKFVAGFLGTPPMNFFDGKIESSGNDVYLINSDFKIKLSSAHALKLAQKNGKNVVMGVRPESLSTNQYDGCGQNEFSAKVKVIEPLGDRQDVYMNTSDGVDFVANIDPHVKLKTDDEVQMFIDIEKVHIFEMGETGVNLTL